MIIEFVREDLSAARGLMRGAWGPTGKMNDARLQLIEIISGVERSTEFDSVYQVDGGVLQDQPAVAFSWVVEAVYERKKRSA